MLLDPKVELECNYCEHAEAFDMTPLAGGVFDMRAVEGNSSTNHGWIWAGDDVHYCSEECQSAKENDND